MLALADGTLFNGLSVGARGLSVGEVVFNTSMSGYQEIISDPSYARQIINFTCPHIGNVGFNDDDYEADRIHSAGVVMRQLSPLIAGHRGRRSLTEVLVEQGIVAIADVDTRHLTHLIRDSGSIAGCLMAVDDPNGDEAVALARSFAGLSGQDLAREVSGPQRDFSEGGDWYSPEGFRAPEVPKWRVVVVDFGVKRSILRCLVTQGCRVTVVPATATAEHILSLHPDGVLLSNGPGDPEPCDYAIATIRQLLGTGLPLMGICLGFQLLALACGGRTEKMKFGHHGANHPVRDLSSEKVMITSQNHCFAVSESNLPDCLQITHRSLFDGSLQGLKHLSLPAFGFQGHPEASPGPQEARAMFEDFIGLFGNSRN